MRVGHMQGQHYGSEPSGLNSTIFMRKKWVLLFGVGLDELTMRQGLQHKVVLGAQPAPVCSSAMREAGPGAPGSGSRDAVCRGPQWEPVAASGLWAHCMDAALPGLMEGLMPHAKVCRDSSLT